MAMAAITPAASLHPCGACISALPLHSNAFSTLNLPHQIIQFVTEQPSTRRASVDVLACAKFLFGRRYSMSRVAQSPCPITQLAIEHPNTGPRPVIDSGRAESLLRRRHSISTLAQTQNLACLVMGKIGESRIQAAVAPPALEEEDICSPELILETMAFLEEDLPHLFDEKGIDKSRYEKQVEFRDPLTRYDTLDGYLFNIRMLRFLFAPIFKLHKVTQTRPNEITTRWTMTMNFLLLPWRPQLVFTGTSVMGVNPKTGKFLSHVDFWDSIKQNEYFSFEAVMDLLKQMRYYKTPDLETPKYLVLKRTAEYEVRKYEPFIVVETQGDRVTGSKGFNDVAGYIFGKNATGDKIPMTTPVFTKTLDNSNVQIQIVLPLRSKISELPAPLSDRVELQEFPGAIMAAKKFSGPPSEDAVIENERRLRSALAQDGLNAKEGFMVARYNDPGRTWKYVMRNEVLISLEDFELQ